MRPVPSPSLLAHDRSASPSRAPAARLPDSEPRTLRDLFYPGFYMVLLLRDGHAPADCADFRGRLRQLLAQVDEGARNLRSEPEDVQHAKFAFCALIDEIVLASDLQIRSDWERDPLQLEIFGEHMAGEKFFAVLERLRGDGARRLQALEVFQMCLLLGFQGRYVLDGEEKLSWLTARLGDEIVHLRGERPAFAPHWAPPDSIAHRLRSEVPLWAMGVAFASAALVAFAGMRWHLDRGTLESLAGHTDIVRLAPQPAYVTITLP